MTGIRHVSRIAAGGYGEVHKMFDEATQQNFARKILRLFGGVRREDIDNEVRAISQLCSGGRCLQIVEVIRHGWFPDDDAYYYIDMEYCSETLNDRIQETVRWDPRADPEVRAGGGDGPGSAEPDSTQVSRPTEDLEALLNFDLNQDSVTNSDLDGHIGIVEDIVNALIYIHDSSMVHRDLKPQNVLFSQSDKCWKVADFGTVSNATSSRQNTTHLSRGTASYRAPEILDSTRPKFNNKTDIFALGSIFYEIVTGDKLFYDDFAIVNYSATGNLRADWWPEASSDVAPRLAALEKLIASMLEIDHHRRPSAKEIQRELFAIRLGMLGSFDLRDSGMPIQRYLISDPYVPRRHEHRRIPSAKPVPHHISVVEFMRGQERRKKYEAELYALMKAPMKAEDAVLQQMAAALM